MVDKDMLIRGMVDKAKVLIKRLRNLGTATWELSVLMIMDELGESGWLIAFLP